MEAGVMRYPTHEELAREFNVAKATISRKAGREDWAEQRKLFTAKVQQLRQEQRSEELASESAKFDQDCLNVARAGLQLAAADIKLKSMTPEQVAALREQGRLPSGLGITYPNIAQAVSTFQAIGRRALGEAATTDKSVVFRVVYDDEITPSGGVEDANGDR